jgi:hypothetical protein
MVNWTEELRKEIVIKSKVMLTWPLMWPFLLVLIIHCDHDQDHPHSPNSNNYIRIFIKLTFTLSKLLRPFRTHSLS